MNSRGTQSNDALPFRDGLIPSSANSSQSKAPSQEGNLLHAAQRKKNTTKPRSQTCPTAINQSRSPQEIKNLSHEIEGVGWNLTDGQSLDAKSRVDMGYRFETNGGDVEEVEFPSQEKPSESKTRG